MDEFYDDSDFYPERIIRNDDRRGLVHLEDERDNRLALLGLTGRERVIARKGGAE